MFSTPLISCSSGVATVRDTVSAEAPGKCVVICTVGGTISGYCEIGRMASAPSPMSVRKTLSTVAKIGLSMKLWVTARSCFSFCCQAFLSALAIGAGVVMDGAVLRRDLGAGNRAQQAVDDNPVGGLEAGLDHPQPTAKLARGYDLRLYGRVGGNRHHQVLRLVEHDRGIRQQIDRRRRRDRDVQPGELPLRQERVRIGHGGPRMNGPARPIERIVDEVERAWTGKTVLVAEADQNLVGEGAADTSALARKRQEIGFAHVEVEIERVERHHGGEQRG